MAVSEESCAEHQAVFTVALSPGGPKLLSQDVTVEYATADGTAVAGVDYRRHDSCDPTAGCRHVPLEASSLPGAEGVCSVPAQCAAADSDGDGLSNAWETRAASTSTADDIGYAWCSGGQTPIPGTGPVDFNCDGSSTQTWCDAGCDITPALELTHDPLGGGTVGGDQLVPYEDWPNLVFAFHCESTYGDLSLAARDRRPLARGTLGQQ